MSPEQIYSMHPEYGEYDGIKSTDCLNRIITIVKRWKIGQKEDNEALRPYCIKWEVTICVTTNGSSSLSSLSTLFASPIFLLRVEGRKGRSAFVGNSAVLDF
jgi:hypothetical protein